MEETVVPKRPREEPQVTEDAQNICHEKEPSKRHKPYNNILSLLESEELEDSTQDLSPFITTLQQEITNCASDSDTLLTQEHKLTTTSTPNSLEKSSTCTTHHSNDTVKDDDKERVMRHLLEASDDELGIPNRVEGLLDFGEDGFNGGDMFSSICDGLWELEDETANYYALLQSGLFL
ncbi:uncharacterized protein LOC113858783 [Abrus precatorius]|uniref:Uncharacterized protein LOC113858783 n=1 Tax=Abrus precatorius TaxID=3816 RepID=A0A8B8KTV1_ABRPR|nr:uncharacterized protein LOC113858783 [Abrus precatorius]